MSEVRCVLQAFDQLGEGPCWSSLDGRLYWFDIKGRRLSWLEPENGESGAFDLPLRASAAAPRRVGGLVLATEGGLAVFDPDTGEFQMRRPMRFEPGFRSNDGKVGLDGQFWWSIMDDAGGERPGAVFRTTPAWETTRLVEGVHIANTVSQGPDGRLYLADSKHQTMFAHDAEDVGRREVFFHTRGESCTPDGSAFDAKGYLWNAQWGGWRLVRYAPDGSVDRMVEVPVEQPTSCAFGGPDLATLYITSAWDDLSDEARAAQPLAGALFAFEPGVPGLPLPLFEG